MGQAPSYVELVPVPALAGAVRTTWIQSTGPQPYLQRHLPTGGAELHWLLGGEPQLLGPLTGPLPELIPARTTLVGVRFRPGAPLPVPVPPDQLVDRRVAVRDLGAAWPSRLPEDADPATALAALQRLLVRLLRSAPRDRVAATAVRLLMPWTPREVGSVADELGLSASQLRRRCTRAVGVGPKSLQRTLRFQAFLALAQAGAVATGRRGADGIAGLAVDVGYADQAHLSREVRRLTGVTPRELLGGDVDRCLCGHDHTASYAPFLAGRGPVRVPFKTGRPEPS